MTTFFQHYNFLTLALIFTLPGIFIWLLRPDLRSTITTIAVFALPFACTEFMFYPAYWEPNFLFDLGRRIGFGLEDIIFVCGLAAFTTTAYAVIFNRKYTPKEPAGLFSCTLRALGLFTFSGLFFLGLIIAGVTVIYSVFLVMIACTCVIALLRRDLTAPSLLGGCLSAAIYFLLCLLAEKIIPGLFKNVWNTHNYLNIFIVVVPLEEVLYGFTAGLAATAFYPYILSRQFTNRRG